MTLKIASSALAVLLGASCASTGTTPNPKAESSSAAIRAAEEVGATHDPRAALHLQLAKEQAENAKALTKGEDKARAERLLMRAQVDAELALALARTESEKVEAQQAIQKVNALKLSVTQ